MSATNAMPLTDRLLAATLDLIWRQWRAIGGAAAGGPVRSQVDLEVLCLASLALETHEPRLWVTMADWLRTGSTLVSVQRLKNLTESFVRANERVHELAHVAIHEAKDERWRTLAAGKRRGHTRHQKLVKARSAGPVLQTGPSLLLRMRVAFGLGIKADLLAFLIGTDHRVTVTTAATSLGYSTPAVFRALRDLQNAGFLRAWDGPSATEYWIMPQQWVELLGGQEHLAAWQHWSERVSYACAAIEWETRSKTRSMSDYARAVSLREIMAPHREQLARALGVHTPIPESAVLGDWKKFHDVLARQSEAQA